MEFGAITGDDLRFLHQAFITDTISNALLLNDVDIRLYFIDIPERRRLVKIVTNYLLKKNASGMNSDFKKRFKAQQLDHDRWGIRIEKVFEDCFAAGYEQVLVVGSRTPTITADMYQSALEKLCQSDAVFGPTPEGRYYVIGMSGSYHISLSQFDWKSPSIYSEVSEAFTSKELAWSELDIWYPVETSDGLEIMARDINQYRLQGDEHTARETELVLERILSKLG